MEILEREGALTFDRPQSIAIQDTFCGGMRLLTMGIGHRLKKYRRIIQTQLQGQSIQAYQAFQLRNAVNLVNGILSNPEEHQEHAKCFAASFTITLLYGKPTSTKYSDPAIQKIMFFTRRFGRVVKPNTYLIDSFPLLKHLPGYLSELQGWHQEELEFNRSLVDEHKTKAANGEPLEPCFLHNLLDKQQEFELSDNEIAFVPGSIFIAGSDTTSSALSVMMMAAACYPETQTVVQAQLDAVVGKERCHNFSDEPTLTRVTAFVLEVFRWRPISAGGFVHRATKDIIWNGYRIPEGASIFGIHWSIARSPDVFPEPEMFNPDRWINADGNIRDDIKPFGFGFGRRICPWQQVAIRSMFICTAMLLSNVHPMPFSLVFESRLPVDKLNALMIKP